MEARADRVADRFERQLVVAAVLTIPVTILQLLPAGDPWRTIADLLNWAIWLAFLAEMLIMLAVVSSRRQWLRRHVVDGDRGADTAVSGQRGAVGQAPASPASVAPDAPREVVRKFVEV
jgi:hypothetical protein